MIQVTWNRLSAGENGPGNPAKQPDMDIVWFLKKFSELSTGELYSILRLRSEVFVVEQNCVFQDIDNKDQGAYHFMGWHHDLLCAYTRIVPAGAAFHYPSIGRVVTSPKTRGGGLGRLLMEKSIEETVKLFGKTDIELGAQFHLKKFYTSMGFIQTSEIYLEDGIEHIEMIRKFPAS
jgi:ElaA protein